MVRTKSTASSAQSIANPSFEQKLWLTADNLRKNMDATEPRGARQPAVGSPKGQRGGAGQYQAENIFWLPAEARWSYLQGAAKLPTIGKTVDDAMVAIKRDNPRLKGVFPKDYARPGLDKQRLGELIDVIATIELTAASEGEKMAEHLRRMGALVKLPISGLALAPIEGEGRVAVWSGAGRSGRCGQNGRARRKLNPMEPEPLIPKHGGYRKLKSFQIAQLCYDVTVRFCDRYISPKSRTHDQMVQAARSGVQNLAEGSQASGTSKKFELKLTNVARASLEELRLGYEDFLRQRGLPLWPEADPRRKALVARRCTTADAVADWVREVHGPDGRNGPDGQLKRSAPSMKSIPSIQSTYPEIAANAALVLIGVACALLDRQIEAQAAAFTEEGGFTERLHRIRTERKKYGPR